MATHFILVNETGSLMVILLFLSFADDTRSPSLLPGTSKMNKYAKHLRNSGSIYLPALLNRHCCATVKQTQFTANEMIHL